MFVCAPWLSVPVGVCLEVKNVCELSGATDRDLESGFEKEHKCQDPKDGELLCLEGPIREKPWWRPLAMLASKSFVKLLLRGERAHEPSSSCV